MQGDGNLVLYKYGSPIWDSKTTCATCYFIFETSGDLRIRSNTVAQWSSYTNGKSATSLTLRDDGNLVLYNNSSIVWQSNTAY
jgi:hypothetical protein